MEANHKDASTPRPSRRDWGLWIFWTIVGLVILGVLVEGVYSMIIARRYEHRAVRTTGELIDVALEIGPDGERIRDRSRDSTPDGYITYRFEVPDNGGSRSILIEDQGVAFPFLYMQRLGEPIEVFYFPEQPEQSAIVEIDHSGEERVVWLGVMLAFMVVLILCVRIASLRKAECEALPDGRLYRFSPYLVETSRMILLLCLLLAALFTIVGIFAPEDGKRFLVLAVIIPLPFMLPAVYVWFRHAGVLNLTSSGVERRRLGKTQRIAWDEIEHIERVFHLPPDIVVRGNGRRIRFSTATAGLPHFLELASRHLRTVYERAALERDLENQGQDLSFPFILRAPPARRLQALCLPPLLLFLAAGGISWWVGGSLPVICFSGGLAALVGLALAYAALPPRDAVCALVCEAERLRLQRYQSGWIDIPAQDLSGFSLGSEEIPIGMGVSPLQVLVANGLAATPLLIQRRNASPIRLDPAGLRRLGPYSPVQLVLILAALYNPD